MPSYVCTCLYGLYTCVLYVCVYYKCISSLTTGWIWRHRAAVTLLLTGWWIHYDVFSPNINPERKALESTYRAITILVLLSFFSFSYFFFLTVSAFCIKLGNPGLVQHKCISEWSELELRGITWLQSVSSAISSLGEIALCMSTTAVSSFLLVTVRAAGHAANAHHSRGCWSAGWAAWREA